MRKYTFLVEWTDSVYLDPAAVVASGKDVLEARENANRVATEYLKEVYPDIEGLNALDNDGYVIAVLRGDVTDRLVGEYHCITLYERD